jgi:hypothetical protein
MSRRSARDGSKGLPRRTDVLVRSAALIAVKSIARWLTSVAMTWSVVGGEKRRAPLPVPMSSAPDAPARRQRGEPEAVGALAT